MTIDRKAVEKLVSESLNNMILKKRVENLVRESLTGIIKNKLNEDSDDKIGDNENDEKYKSVMSALQNIKYDRAQIAYDLWNIGKDDKSGQDTARSLFSKMANGTPDDDGVVRHFSSEEINKLYEILRNLGQ